MYLAKIYVQLKKDVLDAQGKAAKKALESSGFQMVKDVKIGKEIRIILDEDDKEIASEKVKQMCESLLVNHVMEDYDFDIVEVKK
ncbi:MAG TPA: phosphoribosylformylglycinamidine synthase subunit PurS [Thermoanaerobacterales bacterium]|nr:phosphoribosylformylglycinamidine synthase subunit PurS [Thermoanaerobacterales bacterium]